MNPEDVKEKKEQDKKNYLRSDGSQQEKNDETNIEMKRRSLRDASYSPLEIRLRSPGVIKLSSTAFHSVEFSKNFHREYAYAPKFPIRNIPPLKCLPSEFEELNYDSSHVNSPGYFGGTVDMIKFRPVGSYPLKKVEYEGVEFKSIGESSQYETLKFIQLKHISVISNLPEIEYEETFVAGTKEPDQEIMESWGGSVSHGINENLYERREFIFLGSSKALFNSSPKVIVFQDGKDVSFLNFLRFVLALIYRQVNGGLPESYDFRTPNKEDASNVECVELIKNRFYESLRIGGRLISIDLETCNIIEGVTSEEDDKKNHYSDPFKESLIESVTDKLGFLILRTIDEETSTRALDYLHRVSHYMMNKFEIIKIDTNVPEYNMLVKLAMTLNGVFIDTPPPARPINFDSLFNGYRRHLEKYLSSILVDSADIDYALLTDRGKKRNPYEIESPEHYLMKTFVVSVLVQKLKKYMGSTPVDLVGEIRDRILTERSPATCSKMVNEDHSEIVSDIIFINSEKEEEYFEIETLFSEGVGITPIKKIQETIEKYEKIGCETGRLHIILDPLTFILYLDEIIRIRQWFEQSEKQMPEVVFETLDIPMESKEGAGLISLEEVYEIMKNLPSIFNVENAEPL